MGVRRRVGLNVKVFVDLDVFDLKLVQVFDHSYLVYHVSLVGSRGRLELLVQLLIQVGRWC